MAGQLIFVLVALLVASSGAVGLVARAKSPGETRKRQLVAPTFRLVAGLVILGIALVAD